MFKLKERLIVLTIINKSWSKFSNGKIRKKKKNTWTGLCPALTQVTYYLLTGNLLNFSLRSGERSLSHKHSNRDVRK